MDPAPALCEFSGPTYLFFSDNVAPLVYYSHLPVMLAAFLLGLFILSRGVRSLPNQILAVLTFTFGAWVFMDSVFWASNRSDVIMFVWSAIVLIEPLVHVSGFYLLYVLVTGRDLPFLMKMLLFALYLPLMLLAPTTLNLSSFDTFSCLAEEGILAKYYSYGVEIATMLFVVIFAAIQLRNKRGEERLKVLLLSTSVFLLLFAFSWGNIIGSFTDAWEIAQYGLFGMPIFIAFLLYSIVRFRVFQTKIIGATALVVLLCGLTFGLLFVDQVDMFRAVAFATFALSLVFGLMLIRSVRHEVRQRERIEAQEKALQAANRQQESLLHFISHEVKGYLTDGQNAFAGIMQGDFGKVPPSLAQVAETALGKMRQGVRTVMEILDAANLKLGTMIYKKDPFDFKAIVEEACEHMRPKAEERGLSLHLKVDSGEYITSGDKEKIAQHVIRNLIDNAIRYTQKGSIHVALTRAGNNILLSVKDTGVGITKEDKPKLFTEGGHGKDSIKVNVDSTGYGLFVAKQVVEAHGGTIRAESAGAGKGSEFIVELPVT